MGGVTNMSPIMNNMPLFVAHSEWLAPEAYSSPGLNYLCCISTCTSHFTLCFFFFANQEEEKEVSGMEACNIFFWGTKTFVFVLCGMSLFCSKSTNELYFVVKVEANNCH